MTQPTKSQFCKQTSGKSVILSPLFQVELGNVFLRSCQAVKPCWLRYYN